MPTLITMLIASALLHPWVVLALVGHLVVWLLYKLRIRDALITVLTVGGGFALVRALKEIIAEPRPLESLIDVSGYGFPSGHAAGAVLVSAVVMHAFFSKIRSRGWRILAYAVISLIVILVGVSRVYLGAHDVPDVIAGYIVGALWAVFVMYVAGRGKGKRKFDTLK